MTRRDTGCEAAKGCSRGSSGSRNRVPVCNLITSRRDFKC